MPKEIFGYNKPVFRQQLLTEGLTREVYIAPETCPTKNLSFWIVRPSELKEQPKDQPRGTYDVHEGMEEGVYIVKGRVKLLTPNESVTLEQGGCAWIPAGMPHRAEVLSDEIVAVAIFGPARNGKAKSRLITAEEAKKIAKKLIG